MNNRGLRLYEYLQSFDLSMLWRAYTDISWMTGKIDNHSKTDHIYDSTYVSAMCYDLDITFPVPTEDVTFYLANAFYNWLRTSGPYYGWFKIPEVPNIQSFANRGYLVIVCLKNDDLNSAGHMAIVLPNYENDDFCNMDNLRIIQAGIENYNCTTLQKSFIHHTNNISLETLAFYAHKIDNFE